VTVRRTDGPKAAVFKVSIGTPLLQNPHADDHTWRIRFAMCLAQMDTDREYDSDP
jgi:hypothetical protein